MLYKYYTEGQKSARGTVWGLHFYKETDKIYKNALFLEFLAYLYFVVWLNSSFYNCCDIISRAQR